MRLAYFAGDVTFDIFQYHVSNRLLCVGEGQRIFYSWRSHENSPVPLLNTLVCKKFPAHLLVPNPIILRLEGICKPSEQVHMEYKLIQAFVEHLYFPWSGESFGLELS